MRSVFACKEIKISRIMTTGATLVETALLVSLIALVCFKAVDMAGRKSYCKFCKLNWLNSQYYKNDPGWVMEVVNRGWFEGGVAWYFSYANCSNCPWCPKKLEDSCAKPTSDGSVWY